MTYSCSNALSSVWFVNVLLCLSKSSREAFAFHVTSIKRLIARLKIVAPWFHNSLNDNVRIVIKSSIDPFLPEIHPSNRRTGFKRKVGATLISKAKHTILL